MSRRALVLAAAAGVLAAAWFLFFRNPDFVRGKAAGIASFVSAERIEAQARALSEKPHRAGTPANEQVAAALVARLEKAGLKVTASQHKVDLWEPVELRLALVAPTAKEIDLHEKALPEDPYSQRASMEMPFLAFSGDGAVEAPVVYVNFGDRADYDVLKKRGIDVKGKIALVRAQGLCRGMKGQIAEERGVAGLLLYPEPRDQGFNAPAWPSGPNVNRWAAQRGSMLRYYLYPGDAAGSIAAGGPDTRPRIPALAISQDAAEQILSTMDGAAAPEEWKGWLKAPYLLSTKANRARLVVKGAVRTRTIRNVFARIPGSDEGARALVVGNHYDAWVYGAVDPSSGTAVVLEAAEALARLGRHWWKPRRTIVIAFWDAEEYGMVGSTKWMEEQIRAGADLPVAYVNIDTASRSGGFLSNLTPGLRGSLQHVLEFVEDPDGKKLLSEIHGDSQLPGFSSDTSPFAGLSGMPVAELGFGRWYGNYHTLYDDPAWLKEYGDPGFRRSAALARILALYAGSLAASDVFPFRFSELGAYATKSLADISGPNPGALPWLAGALGPLEHAIDLYGGTAKAWDANLAKRPLFSSTRAAKADALVLGAIGSFGLRPVADHEALLFGRCNLLLGPSDLTGCAAEPFPALQRAVRAHDEKAIRAAADKLTAAFVRARDQLQAADFILHGKGRR
jgi:N-acetylated-alpha-linked acidic dipeptidase